MSNFPFKLIQEEIYNVFGTDGQFEDYDVHIDSANFEKELKLPHKMSQVQISVVQEIIMNLTKCNVEINKNVIILY